MTDPEKFGGSADDSFDVVLISLPGYGFSSPLKETGWNWWHTADLENTLMKDVLGYENMRIEEAYYADQEDAYDMKLFFNE